MNRTRAAVASTAALIVALTTTCALMIGGGGPASASTTVIYPTAVPVRVITTTTPGSDPGELHCNELICYPVIVPFAR